MWVARFVLKDDEDIYSPLCVKHNVDFYASPHTNFEKDGKLNLLLSGIISGKEDNKNNFLADLKKDTRVKSVERHHDFLLVHVQHPVSREARAEIKIFYNPQYVMGRPVKVSNDGFEYWEVACLDRDELNKLVRAAIKHYHGKLISMKKDSLRTVASLELNPFLTVKQLEALKLAYSEGYYEYPRGLTMPELAKILGKSYSAFQENLRRAEGKLVDYFLKYR